MGDSVKITEDAPEKYQKIGVGSICGIREVTSKVVAKDFGEPIEGVLYLVEGPEGEAIEIPEKFLIRF